MASDRALLIEGPAGAAAGSVAGVGEALRASGAPWEVRRLSWIARGEDRLDDQSLRYELAAIGGGGASACALLVVAGAITGARDEPRLVLGRGRTTEPPTWPLAEIAAAVAHAHVGIVVAVVTGAVGLDAAELAARLASPRSAAIAAITDAPQEVIDALIAGLRGAARDPRHGAITAASLAVHLAAGAGAAAALPHGELRDAPWFEPPSLERLWRLGWSIHTGAPAQADDGDALVGTILPGQFRIDASIATGGFGRIYRARQLAVDRDVAVKVLRVGVGPFSEEGRLFVHEIQAVARIDHPNVVRVYQADVTADGRLFFAMELLAGRDLDELARLEPARAIALIRQLLAALGAAHHAGLVHADVKPANAIVVGERLVLVDFGLSRLRRVDADADLDAESAGGTPAFMAPEQLRAGRVDARSDQFSAALVLVALLVGWRRAQRTELLPPPDALAAIASLSIRAAVTRALAIVPADRFPSVTAFAAALAGDEVEGEPAPSRPPFHGLAAFTEDDRGQLHGRGRELSQLTELVLYRRLVIVTAPSGVGKTSLLRAGLVPRLGALGTVARYASCRTDDEASVACAVAPGVATLMAALAEHEAVIVVDQVEAALEAREGAPTRTLLDAAISAASRSSGGRIVLSVREDFLARVLERLPDRGDAAQIVRIGPLEIDGARDAIVRPLAEHRIAVEPALLDALLDDLAAAGAGLGAEFGWGTARRVYPLHLQLACSVLYDRLAAGEATLSLAHYRALGGFDAIAAEHLDHVLDDFEPSDTALARELFLALVTSTQLRSARTERELTESIAPERRAGLPRVLEVLRRQGLIVRARRAGGELVWELIHDSLVPRVLAWVDRHDLARRHAIELLRYHLRRSRAVAPSLLSRAELRELAEHDGAIAAVDDELRRTPGVGVWTARTLVARSRQVHRRSLIAACALGATVIAGTTVALLERWRSESERRTEAEHRDRDLGLVTLELAPFDWDAARAGAVPVAISELPRLAWRLHAPAPDDPSQPGEVMSREHMRLLATRLEPNGASRLDSIEVRGGAAFVVITGRGRANEDCDPSLVPLRALPGYARRGTGSQRLRLAVPTCRATRSGMIEIAAGPFVFGGLGVPASDYQRGFPARSTERIVDLAAYWIDRTEVTNAAFAVFGAMKDATGIAPLGYIENADLARSADLESPASSMTWREARAYCAFLGKQLPTSQQWEKALRGGLANNPQPRRNFPWGIHRSAHDANLAEETPKGPRHVGSYPLDRSPYGVVDLAGNVAEWIGTPFTGTLDETEFYRGSTRVIRGGNWSETPSDDLVNYTPIENARPADTRAFTIGIRCASLFGS